MKPEKLDIVEKVYAQAGFSLERIRLSAEDEIIAACGDAEILPGTGDPPITARVIEALPKLKFVQRFGVNSIDLDAAAAHGICDIIETL